MTTAETIRVMVAEQLGVSESEVVPNARFKEDLGADSLDGAHLALEVEEQFGLPPISEKQMADLTTVQRMVYYVEQALEAHAVKHPEKIMTLREVIAGLEKADRMLLTAESRLTSAPENAVDEPEGVVVMVFSETVVQNIIKALRSAAV
jgi:acyl carrier protein